MSDRTCPIRCQATQGIDSYDQTLSSSDRTLSEAVIGRTGDTVHRHDSVFNVTGRSRLDDRTHKVHHPIKSREVLERRQRDRMRPVALAPLWNLSGLDRTLHFVRPVVQSAASGHAENTAVMMNSVTGASGHCCSVSGHSYRRLL